MDGYKFDRDVHLDMMHRAEKVFGSREGHLFWQLLHYTEHPRQRFDVTFYDREPILEVTLGKCSANDLRTMLRHGDDYVQFSDGTSARMSEIWTLNFIPDNLDIRGVDMSQADYPIGLGGETVREIIRNTYHCKSRAEEDYFIARWIAS